MNGEKEKTPKMFKITGKQRFKPEEDMDFSDFKLSVPPAPPEANTSKDRKTEFKEAPGDTNIERKVREYAESEPAKPIAPTNETAGFKPAGERIRVVIPEDTADPEHVARVTQLGLSAIRAIEKTRSEKTDTDKDK